MARLTAAQVASIIKKEFRFANTDGINEFVTEKQLQKLIASLAVTVEKLVDGVGVDAASTTEQVVKMKTVAITRTQFLALSTAALEILEAPETGFVNILLPAVMRQTSYTAAYTSTNNAPLYLKEGDAYSDTILQTIASAIYLGSVADCVQGGTSDNTLARTVDAVYLQAPYNLPDAAFATLAVGTGTAFELTIPYITLPIA